MTASYAYQPAPQTRWERFKQTAKPYATRALGALTAYALLDGAVTTLENSGKPAEDRKRSGIEIVVDAAQSGLEATLGRYVLYPLENTVNNLVFEGQVAYSDTHDDLEERAGRDLPFDLTPSDGCSTFPPEYRSPTNIYPC